MATRIKSKPAKNIDEYIAGFPVIIQERMEQLRAAIHKAAPGAEESISYSIAAFKLHGTLIFFAGFKNHIGIYPVPRTNGLFKKELESYKGGKGTAQIPHDEPIPFDLVTRIVMFRLKENKEILKKKTSSR